MIWWQRTNKCLKNCICFISSWPVRFSGSFIVDESYLALDSWEFWCMNTGNVKKRIIINKIESCLLNNKGIAGLARQASAINSLLQIWKKMVFDLAIKFQFVANKFNFIVGEWIPKFRKWDKRKFVRKCEAWERDIKVVIVSSNCSIFVSSSFGVENPWIRERCW